MFFHASRQSSTYGTTRRLGTAWPLNMQERKRVEIAYSLFHIFRQNRDYFYLRLPVGAVERAVLDSLGDMAGKNLVHAVQVGHGPGDAQNAVIRARG